MRRWIPVLFYALFLYWVSDRTTAIPLPQFFFMDKLLHLGAYGIFGILCARAASSHKLLVAFLIATLYGLFDEIHQSWVPGRMTEVGDLVADSLGGFLGAVIYLRIQKWPRLSRIME